MKLVQHPNVVKLYEVIDTSSKMYLVLELGQGDLYDLILRQQGGLPECSARVYFTQILTAVSYCHKLHVAHRDLKPENVVFFPPNADKPSVSSSSKSVLGQVKLTDFGFSNKFCPGVNLDTSCGSLAYSAPEILLGDSYDAPAVDIWSLGVILYMLVCGRAPFQEANDSETLIMIMDVKYSIPDVLSRELKDLIRRMLVRDPARRATLDQIETHEWVRLGGDVKIRTTVPLIAYNTISEAESDRICNEMVKGGIVASYDEVKSSVGTNAYNHVTSTYYL
ncbi:SNF-related serine/threonine-protein kinase [Orchesella cincta]|uniref:SNF-related serine/threonine-protein kinase n=1 Tax=Orchesella cincta TaxID=48709 RepID=A0A1D2MDY1_ORCCI|nr:SNF-related serine/threonine-protein kinase [Orchesella cincta]